VAGDTPSPYLLVAVGSTSYVSEISAALTAAVEDQLKMAAVDVGDSLPRHDDPTDRAAHVVVVVAVEGPESLSDQDVETVNRALEAAVPVLPVLCGAAKFRDLDAPLSMINGVEWRNQEQVVQQIVRLLGMAEEDRKLFLSYKRADSEALAFQLRYALQDRGFDVFLDRYAIPPAVDFQDRLDIELSDKAFVLLLEGPTTIDSEWVRHEVTYALRHHISLIALTLPGVERAQMIDSVPDELRIRLHDTDVIDEDGQIRLTDECLSHLLTRLEWEHALRLRRHRQQLVDTLSDWLRQSGHEVAALPGWTLVAQGGPNDGVYLITPRAPTPEDLRRADLARRGVDEQLGAIVAHNPELIDGARKDLIVWIAGRQGDLRAEHHAGLRLITGAR